MAGEELDETRKLFNNPIAKKSENAEFQGGRSNVFAPYLVEGRDYRLLKRI